MPNSKFSNSSKSQIYFLATLPRIFRFFSWYFVVFLVLRGTFCHFFPISSCFFPFLPGSYCFLPFLPGSFSIFQFLPVSFSSSFSFSVLSFFFLFLPVSSCFPLFFLLQFILPILLQEFCTDCLGLVTTNLPTQKVIFMK